MGRCWIEVRKEVVKATQVGKWRGQGTGGECGRKREGGRERRRRWQEAHDPAKAGNQRGRGDDRKMTGQASVSSRNRAPKAGSVVPS